MSKRKTGEITRRSALTLTLSGMASLLPTGAFARDTSLPGNDAAGAGAQPLARDDKTYDFTVPTDTGHISPADSLREYRDLINRIESASLRGSLNRLSAEWQELNKTLIKLEDFVAKLVAEIPEFASSGTTTLSPEQREAANVRTLAISTKEQVQTLRRIHSPSDATVVLTLALLASTTDMLDNRVAFRPDKVISDQAFEYLKAIKSLVNGPLHSQRVDYDSSLTSHIAADTELRKFGRLAHEQLTEASNAIARYEYAALNGGGTADRSPVNQAFDALLSATSDQVFDRLGYSPNKRPAIDLDSTRKTGSLGVLLAYVREFAKRSPSPLEDDPVAIAATLYDVTRGAQAWHGQRKERFGETFPQTGSAMTAFHLASERRGGAGTKLTPSNVAGIIEKNCHTGEINWTRFEINFVILLICTLWYTPISLTARKDRVKNLLRNFHICTGPDASIVAEKLAELSLG